jgi:lipopolysaccharide transport system ATP-binding protein
MERSPGTCSPGAAGVRGRKTQTSLISSVHSDSAEKDSFLARTDSSCAGKRGDRIGIIGKTGAGKSTLLKILSKITSPTRGEIRIKGRVGSLLEVGTGFHPELTGRENIYLNGLGMTRREIDRKLEEIIDFAGIEKHIDTPVKRYSSGMNVRLGFAVAAHLDPEILVVDEVLAVGDAEFQKKAIGKMENISKGEGRTILFVSHNMDAIRLLCDRGVYLNSGRIDVIDKDINHVIKKYITGDEVIFSASEWTNTDKYQNDYFQPIHFYLSDEEGKKVSNPLRNDQEIWVNIEGIVRKKDSTLMIGFQLYTEDGVMLFGSAFTDGKPEQWPPIEIGRTLLRMKFPKNLLNEGVYKLELNGGLMHRDWFFLPGRENPSIYLEIKGGLSNSPYWTGKRMGLIAPLLKWEN